MKVLITGGGGYLGNIIVRDFLWRPGVELVTCVDLLEHKCNTFWDVSPNPKFKFIKADLMSIPERLEDLYREHDVIIPAAGPVGYPLCETLKTKAWALNNALIVDMLLDIRMLNKRILYICSNSGYGTRPDGGMITEEEPLAPISTYGRSKVAAEKVVLEEGHVSLRLGTVAGLSPCMRIDLLVNDFVWKAVKDGVITVFQGNASRNLVGIQDVSNALLFAMDNFDTMRGQAYNVGDINLTKLELAQKVREHTNCTVVEAEFAEDKDKRDYRISCQKIKDLGFKFEQDLDDLIEDLIRFYSTVSLSSSNIRFENNEYMSLV
jgi:nucleoside-diphosphate-sugar epimerase